MKIQRKGQPNPSQSASSYLSKAMQRFWEHVTTTYALSEHHLQALEVACSSWDRAQQSRRKLRKEGITYLDNRGNPRPHPAVAIELQAKRSFLASMRELGLDVRPACVPHAPELPYRRARAKDEEQEAPWEN